MALSDGTKEELITGLTEALAIVALAAKNVDIAGNNINTPPPEEVWATEIAAAIANFIDKAISNGELEP